MFHKPQVSVCVLRIFPLQSFQVLYLFFGGGWLGERGEGREKGKGDFPNQLVHIKLG